MIKYVLAAMVFIAAAGLLVTAIVEPPEEMLQARYNHIECKTEYTMALIDDMVDAIPEASYLEEHKENLENDLNELQDYVDAVDREGFNNYVRNTHWQNQLDATNALIDARQSFSDWEVSLETRRELRDSFLRHRDDFRACALGSLGDVANAKVVGYEYILDSYEEVVSDLEGKNVDTSGMREIINGAREDVVGPLEDAIAAAGDDIEMRQAIGAYCLGNGCPAGENYHFWAKFTVVKFEAILEVVRPFAERAGLGDDVEECEGYLEAASEALDDAGTDFYTEATRSAVWDNIEGAAEKLHDIVSALKGG